MLKAVDFIARDTFTGLAPEPDLAVISIGDPAEMPPTHLRRFSPTLRLEFLDLEPADLEKWGIPEEALCLPDQVEQVIGFVRALQAAPSAYRLVVHCRMGSSRSAAVALVAHSLTQCDFPRHQDAHYANKHVVALAEAILGQSIAIPEKQPGDEPHPYLPMKLQI